jgi:uridine kinase
MSSPIVIGVAGGTGSGKTTIAMNIIQAFDEGTITLLEHDSYYKDQRNLPMEERLKVNYDHPDSLDNELFIEHLRRLKTGHDIQSPIYDYVTHTRLDETRAVRSTKVIIIEGILIFADKRIRDLCDIKLFIDTDADIRVLRRVRRDLEHRGRTFAAVRNQYYETVRPMHLEFVEPSKRYADLIIPEGGNNRIALEVIIDRIKRQLSES